MELLGTVDVFTFSATYSTVEAALDLEFENMDFSDSCVPLI